MPTKTNLREPEKILVVDVGGHHVKIFATGAASPRKLASGPHMTAREMVRGVRALAADWRFDAISIGYPGAVRHGVIAAEPANLGKGWVGLDLAQAFGRRVKILNDAAMQALGAYGGGHMLFLGLGTGLGSAMIVAGHACPMELAHLPYKKGRTYEDYVGARSLEHRGKKKWRRHVADVIARLDAALQPDEIVIGGGNAKQLRELPARARLGTNADAFTGGFRMWSSATRAARATR